MFLRIESLSEEIMIEEQAWVEAVMSMSALRLVTQGRIKELMEESGEEPEVQVGDAEICNPNAEWCPILFWVASRGTVLIDAPEDILDPNCWMHKIVAELAKRLKASILDDDDVSHTFKV